MPKKKTVTEIGEQATARSGRFEIKRSRDGNQEPESEEHKINQEISARIYNLLKKSGKPIPYHNLTKLLSKDYPGYDYDYFLKEVEGLQKNEKVEVQLVAGKLYFQIKSPN